MINLYKFSIVLYSYFYSETYYFQLVSVCLVPQENAMKTRLLAGYKQ